METIKNLLSGRSKEDETGVPQISSTTTRSGHGGLTGEGSHLSGSQAHDTTIPSTQNIPGAYQNTPTLEKAGHDLQTGTATGTSGTGYPSLGTNQPIHDSSFSNKVDPRVDSNQLSSSEQRAFPLSQSGQLPSSTGVPSHTTSTSQGRDAALGGGGITGAPVHDHDHNRHVQVAGTSAGQQPVHNSSLLNKADPRVQTSQSRTGFDSGNPSSNMGLASSTSGTGYGAGDTHLGSSGIGHSSATSTSNTAPGHNSGRDATLGAAGAAGLAHEHNKHSHNPTTSTSHSSTTKDHGYAASPSGQTSAYHGGPIGTAVRGPHETVTANLLDPHVNTTGGSDKLEDAHIHSSKHGGGAEKADHHHNHGAIAGTGAVGAAGLAEHEQHKHHTGSGSTNLPIRESGAGNTSTTSGVAPFHGSTTSRDPTSSSTHHYGRDAALGAGGAGLAAHEYGKHQGSSSTTGTFAIDGPAPNTSGPHSKDYMNKLDPRVDATGERDTRNIQEGSHTGHSIAGVGAGAGAAGAGVYGAEKLHHQHQDPSHASYATTGPQGTSSTNYSDPALGNERSKEHHYGPDAAGVGAAGAGAYALNKHLNQSEPGRSAIGTSATHHTAPGNYGSGADSGSRNILGRDAQASKDHHYGRDAGLVGSAGAVGAGAYEANKHHNTNQPGYSSSTGPVGTTTTTQTTAGPHSSNLANKADPRVDSDRSKEKDHHYGRDAAAVGAVGAGAYEVNKHHDAKELEKKQKHLAKEHAKEDKHHQKEAEKDQKHLAKEHSKEEKHHVKEIKKEHAKEEKHHQKEVEKEEKRLAKEHAKEEKHEKKGGLFGFLHRDKSKKYSPEEEAEFDRQEREHNSHVGRDAAAMGTVGAAGAGAHHAGHEHDHLHGTPLPEKPLGSDLGDKLHGVERNRGAGATTHSTEHSSTHLIGNTSGASSTKEHHYGRDAAGVGAAGALGTHEYNKHEASGLSPVGVHDHKHQSTGQYSEYNDPLSPKYVHGDSGHASTLENKFDPRVDTSSTPRTGTGAGYGTSDLTGHSGTTHGAGYGEGDRNRLHKDPPSSHPASGHVPASTSETKNVIDQGKRGLESNTGVANAPTTSTSTNY